MAKKKAEQEAESLSFELQAYVERPELPDVAAVLQAQLGELGVKVKIKTGESAGLEPGWIEGDFEAALVSRGYLVDVADPGGYLVSDWTCEGGYNLAQFCDPDTDQQIQDAVAIEDTDERNAAYRELAAKLQGEAASVWLLHENAVWGVQKSVENFQPHPLDMYVLTADLALG